MGYIAQVLKRNRTLKVLNLSDNKIDATGLAALAEALKYNSSLETLDMSSNPCCVTLEGVRGTDCVDSVWRGINADRSTRLPRCGPPSLSTPL